MNAIEIIGTVIAAAGGSAVIIGGIAAWVGSYLAKRIADYRELEFSIDLDLRKLRLPVYRELWAATALLPNWPRAQSVTYGDLQEFSETLRNWYFLVGGYLLSEQTHRYAYSPLQESLTTVLSDKTADTRITETDYDHIRKRCSSLRTRLAADIQTRRESPLAA